MTALLCLIALTASAQDKIGKDKAPAVAAKMLSEAQKKKSAAIKEGPPNSRASCARTSPP
jgi:hypothetical protein